MELGSHESVPSFMDEPILWPTLINVPKTIKHEGGAGEKNRGGRARVESRVMEGIQWYMV